MKIILSRKGFDSSAGKQANPIMPDGTLLSLPIPEKEDADMYSLLQWKGTSYYDIIHSLNPKTHLLPDSKCHLDPDLRYDVKERPDVVHHVGLKTILWGGVAAKLGGVKGVVNAVSGLGVMFSGEKTSLTAKGILEVLRFSHRRKNVKDIFQNSEDAALFYQYKVSKPENSVFIKGSGVNLKLFDYTPVPDTKPNVEPDTTMHLVVGSRQSLRGCRPPIVECRIFIFN